MLDKIVNLMQNNTLVFPRTLLNNYKKMNLTEKEFIFIIYLLNEKSLIFNPDKIGKDLNLTFEEVLEVISNLTTKDLLEIKMVKENNIHQEYLDVDKLYKKLAFYIINEESAKQEKKSNLYDVFEREFGRTLSPNEFMIIGQFDEEYGEELVLCALNESVYNGVRNLRYIDHILAEWRQKGLKNKVDVENSKREFKKEKKETKKLFEYDYLNEDE